MYLSCRRLCVHLSCRHLCALLSYHHLYASNQTYHELLRVLFRVLFREMIHDAVLWAVRDALHELLQEEVSAPYYEIDSHRDEYGLSFSILIRGLWSIANHSSSLPCR